MLDRFRSYRRKHGEFLKIVSTLNAAYLVSSLGDRLWSFSMGIIMHRLGGMTWVAIHQLAEALCKLLLATRVGDILDRVNRSRGIQGVLAVNNVCITISAFCFYLLFSGVGAVGHGSKILLITAIIFGAASRVASEAQKTAFTKDWIVVLIEKSKGARLSTQNGVMNMIDQGAAFLTPFIAGYLLDNYSGAFCCIVIIIWNILSWTLEAVVFLWIYSKTPELAQIRDKEDENEEAVSPFRKYFRQKAFRAMFGLSLLYMTVLGFDNLAISYGASQGMSASQLGFFRSMGSLLGFCGNGVYAIIERFIGVLLTGFIGLTLQNIFINFCSTSVFLPGNPFNATGYMSTLDGQTWLATIRTSIFGGSSSNATEATAAVEPLLIPYNHLPISIIIFFIGITAARFGLWLADPAITQIMQETIPESERYSVYAAQNVFCEAFSIFKDVLVILFPSTETFGALIILSCLFVFAGYLFYISYFISEYSCSATRPAHEEEMKELKSPEQEKLMGNFVDHALKSA